MSRRTNGQATAYMRAKGAPMVEVDLDTLDIARRIQEGDELWRGDPNMVLCYNDLTSKFEVIGVDGKGQPYVVVTSDTCDQRILMALVESDWQQGAQRMVAEAVRRDEAARKQAEAAHYDLNGELADRLAWGIKRAFAQHLGGSKFSYSMNTPGRQ
jgi:hypothetical protein